MTGRRLDYTCTIGLTDLTKNSRPFVFSSTTCFTLLLAATHRHPASTSPARSVSVPIRHPSDKSSVFTSFETGIYLCIAHTRYTHACGVWVVSWSAVAGLLAFSSRQYTPTINRGPLSASHCCSLLSKRSGRRMPPAERSALLIHVVGHIALYQLACCCHVTLVVGEMLSHVTM